MTHPAQATFDAHVASNQDYFLEKFAEVGNVTEACALSNLSVEATRLWERNDVQGFASRLAHARRQYAEFLESLARKRVVAPSFNGRIGSDVLLLGLLNANWPEKYRPNITVTHELGTRVVETLRELQARDREAGGADWQPELPPGRVVEGEKAVDDEKGA